MASAPQTMDEGTMATDLRVEPGVGHIIERPRLTRILDETGARIILLCAPAGYGKTTLARQWVATRQEPVLWHSGGPAMSDVAALAVDLAELFGGGPESELGERVRFLASRGEGPRVLAKAVAAGAPPAGTLVVVDDYHYAGEGSDADAFFRELVSMTSFRLLMGSRIRPSWVDGRKVTYGEATLVEQASLAFTAEEATAVLPYGAPVVHQAEGWPAVIGLAASRAKPESQIARLPPEELYDFIAAELYAAAPTTSQQSLLLLALGGDASRDVARELFGSCLEREIHVALSRGFLVRDDSGWIAIHPLLREFLLRKVQELDRSSRTKLVAEVLDTLRLHACWDQCLRLSELFPLEDRAADVLARALDDLLLSGRTATIDQWTRLAERNQFQDPIFALARAEVALRQGSDLVALSAATEAAKRLTGDFAARAFLTAARAAHQLDDTASTSENVERAGSLAASPELKTEAYWLALMNAYTREPRRLAEHYARFRAVDDPRPERALRLACADAFMRFAEDGDARGALRAAERADALVAQVRDPLLRTNALNVHAHMLRVCGRYEAALEVVERMLTEAERTGLEFVVEHALLTKGAAMVGLRSLGAAREILRTLDKRRSQSSDHVRRNAAMVRARLKIAAGDLKAAALCLAEPVELVAPIVSGEFHSLRALIAAASGNASDASRAIERVRSGTLYDETTAFLALTGAVLDLEQRPESAGKIVLECLERGTVDAVVTACRAAPHLAERAVAGGARVELQAVFSCSHDADLGRKVGLEMPRELRRGEPLSPREREICELLVQGRTNREIAQTLFISESTTKVHLRHIFEKLAVHTRAEAAAAYLGHSTNGRGG